MRVEGFFSGIKNANKAVEKLKISGFGNSRVDLNEHYILNTKHSPKIVGTKNNVNLSSLILNTDDFASEDINSPLKAASPMVSGMGNFEEVSNINYKVVVETDERDSVKVSNIIKELGGDLRNYNLELPKKIE